jgi:hypothetical protein
MPSVFLQNIPDFFNPFQSKTPVKTLNPQQIVNLRAVVAEAAGTSPEGVEIHLSFDNNFLLSDNGYLEPWPNVRGNVVWFGQEQRDVKVKQTIANALQDFLNHHSIGKGFDLTFVHACRFLLC